MAMALLGTARLRERRHRRLSVMPPSPPPFSYNEHPFGGLPSTPPGCTGPVIDSLAELETLAVLGHGAGGTVNKACHRRTGTVLAVKALRAGGDAAIREAEMHLRVAAVAPDHPHVACLHGVFPDGDPGHHRPLCLVLGHAPAGSLGDTLRRRGGRLDDERAIAGVAWCVLRGLRHLHRLGIVHGDVKPSNLLVAAGRCGGEVIKIADFGASRLVSDDGAGHHSTCAFAACTCAYMSPERLDPEGFGAAPGCDFADDVWDLGVVLLECHVGRFPLVPAGKRPDWAALLVAVFSGGTPEVPEAASPEFRGFVRQCLEKDWRRRATVAELLGHPFVAGMRPSSFAGDESVLMKNNQEKEQGSLDRTQRKGI